MERTRKWELKRILSWRIKGPKERPSGGCHWRKASVGPSPKKKGECRELAWVQGAREEKASPGS